MTILDAFKSRKGLWITILTASLAFVILISAPQKSLASGTFTTIWCPAESPTTTNITSHSGWDADICGIDFWNQWFSIPAFEVGSCNADYRLNYGGGLGLGWHTYDVYGCSPYRIIGTADFNYLGDGHWEAYAPPTESYLTIDSPASESTASSTFPLDFTYNFLGEDANKMYIVFEAWSASSTCPLYGTDTWQEEYEAGWFYMQSRPYFSSRLTATSTEASSTMSVFDLDEPYLYNCNYCYFYNEDTATSTLDNKCPDYTLNVSGYVPSSQPLPIGSWENYYASHTDDKFPTSTEIFNTITGSFSSIVQKITSFVNDFRTIFDSESAFTKGSSYGQKIPLIRGYLTPINGFFADIPVSEIFIFCVLILLVVNVYRLVKTILQLIRG